jgi:uncharacterized repeat protein (TIGR03803 family)
MQTQHLSRSAFAFCAAALLAGCGGSQPPIGAPGAMPQASAIAAVAPTIASSKGNISSSYEVLHSFGGSGDGSVPIAGLLKFNGTLFGTTYAGGASGDGTIFSITPSGTETVLHSFGGTTNDGVFPYAGLLNVKGTLYGTTYYGGTNSYGIVFSITPSGTETVLHSFAGYNQGDGLEPEAGLINIKGTLYGTTSGGGANCCGTVFSITPSGTETVLHSFGGSGDGAYPYAGLINVNGTLYGTTARGGANNDGTVFSLTL